MSEDHFDHSLAPTDRRDASDLKIEFLGEWGESIIQIGDGFHILEKESDREDQDSTGGGERLPIIAEKILDSRSRPRGIGTTTSALIDEIPTGGDSET